jgi:hypothetical protein
MKALGIVQPLRLLALGAVAILTPGCPSDVALFGWGINQDGVITGVGDPLPPGAAFDTTTGLGTLSLTFSGSGLHSGSDVDHELSVAVNTF